MVDVQERLRGSGRFSGSESEIQHDSLVCLRASPIYTAGTKAIFCKGNRLQVSYCPHCYHGHHPHTLTVWHPARECVLKLNVREMSLPSCQYQG